MQVALFVTCLVDLMRPRVGFAAVQLLEDAGYEVEVPLQQTCCGQPAYNAGDFERARAIARDVVSAFQSYPYVVAPSGSCAGMLRHHYPRLLADDESWAQRARDLAERTFELTQFLVDVAQTERVDATFAQRIAYHDSCSSLREMQTARQPRALLQQVRGAELCSLGNEEECCGFGGTFCVKYPEISTHMVNRKVQAISQSGATAVVSTDLGCLLNIAGRLARQGSSIRVYHVAEVLAGMGDQAAIGEADAP